MFEQMIFQQKQERILSYLADDCARGRSVGTLAHQNIGKYIRDHFETYGLAPFQGQYYSLRLRQGEATSLIEGGKK